MLSVAQINVRSLHNNFDLLKDHLQNKNYDILGVTETWLNGDISDEVSEINNYTFIRQDRLLNAGGVGIYIKNGLHFSVILQECKPFIEHIWIKITQNHNVLIMGIIYRPPGSSHREFLDYFEDLLPQFYAQSGKIVFLGDFNIDQLDVNFSYTSQLNNIFESFDIKHLVNEPTRVTDRTSTLIDLICSSFDGVFDVENLDINISDHFLTCCFDEASLNLVTSYLTLRTQTVVVDENRSNICNILSGVPQGSILGPLLFKIYTFNIIKSLKHCDYHQYCDDTQLKYSFAPHEAQLANARINSDLQEILTSSNKHLLKINPSKSVAMLFCSENQRHLASQCTRNTNTQTSIENSSPTSQPNYIQNCHPNLTDAQPTIHPSQSSPQSTSPQSTETTNPSLLDSNPIQTPLQPDNVEMNIHSQNQPPTSSDTQSSKRTVSEITSPPTSVDQNLFKEPLRKSKKAKTVPEDNNNLAEDLTKYTSSFFQDNSDNGYLTQEELIDFFENAHGSADPLSIAKTIESLLFECNITEGAFYGDRPAHTILHFPISVDAGFAIDECPHNPIYIPVSSSIREITKITVSVVDQELGPVNFRGEKSTLHLNFKER
ncbi:uncharacterized protein LOC126891086 [Diabrotica virgifera virgifera]|uniref:Reverse transcriptase domain-containing protein n=1 Tax=Diabrotica virgifera virgifera TaxID=50390 RepID=A0ABM5L1A0_DIAVI|nr:uncharacterized protein LOC126891086 [Diabrotica virgifera virgifera]